ncbi:DUF4297 domain-containing protein [Vibrio parahaemolyticus]|uniref:DUF4297 domain-containing protein n=1 Tax=Vibrio parahaemolyticus TaxID=670 RepID=UPI0009F04E40|nr:DUF4297 domain-containing protein [Vibrio parahaemolyticus]EJG1076019.1 DUF4297 domain-containing protein [Vibrio parahaemolyticus O1:K56]OQU03107.1 hypothetical protein EM85_000095 [Vibrio parahaemolyticus]WMN96445.1 DUF4297 domain-containing protein [Vibrio parahaemolyticus]WMN96487.1 DUF4297 domain-containing protein [Vibrio parahaemolyticus]
MVDNILNEPQRETSGAVTFAKYEFQFHWALCKILQKHQKQEDYALLIEYHEDVVIADSLDGQNANFGFYQVKNKTGAKYTVNSLTKRDVGNNGDKNSVLGKLLSSCIGTKYEDRITEIGLVASNGFNLDQDNNELKLDVITVGDLSETCTTELANKIESELGVSRIPNNLKFIIPTIQLANQREYVITKFADLVDSLFPNGMCNAVSIYRAIIDEIHRKGVVKYDFPDWERLVNEKSLTSYTVKEVIAVNTKHSSTDRMIDDLGSLRDELGWSFSTFKGYRRRIETLLLKRTGMPSAFELNRMKMIEECIDSIDPEQHNTLKDGFAEQMSKLKSDLPEGIFHDDAEIMTELLYFYLKD